MRAQERAEAVLRRITDSAAPVSGGTLAGELGVSRQIIVKDIAALKAQGHNIISTTKGYILSVPPMCERVFKVFHSDEDIKTELYAVVDAGGIVENVYVWHKIYGKIQADLNIKTRADVDNYVITLKNGRSRPLMNVTNKYHYHLVKAQSEEILDKVRDTLRDIGFLISDSES